MELSGKSLIGSHDGVSGNDVFQAVSPVSGEALEPEYHSASVEDVELAVRLAHKAFPNYGRLAGRERGTFLRAIASAIELITEAIVERGHQETALAVPRLRGELDRTCAQLRLFAAVIEDGSWTMPRIDRAAPARKPQPKPDIRSMLLPLGPVVVFGASNFPLAFSVAGGDTASALAAGNPVIFKAHPAHPGTSELVARAIQRSIQDMQLPEGVFSLIFDSGTSAGQLLVQHPLVKAVAFTGSQLAGRALFNLATNRPDPIPFYGEMASTNPLFILPDKMAKDGEQVANGLFSSFTLGAGQFCTKPGLVFVQKGGLSETFARSLREKVSKSSEFTLLTSGIAAAYKREVDARDRGAQLKPCVRGKSPESVVPANAPATLFETHISALAGSPALTAEHFGPSTLLVQYDEKRQILEFAEGLNGHLTASIHGTVADLKEYEELIRILEHKVGRIVINGFPTGVEVCHAMVHGGPYPASTDSRTSSVGSLAIFRFVRPVCYQDFPLTMLPPELQNENPLKIWRLVDGEYTRESTS